MTTPLHTATSPYPNECVDGLHDVTRRLRHQLGVTIVHSATVPADDIGWWESPTNTITVRADATTEQRTWLLVAVWLLLVLGPTGRTHIETISPRLRLVPTPRVGD